MVRIYELPTLLDVPQYRDPCPFYRNGVCYAPSLKKPSDVYTVPERCLTVQHYTCSIFLAAVERRPWRSELRSEKRRNRERTLLDLELDPSEEA